MFEFDFCMVVDKRVMQAVFFLLRDNDEHLRPSSLGLSFLRAVDTQTLANFVGDKIRPRCRFHEFFASATYQPTQKRQQTM